jgi:hypothetical protein
MKKVLFTLLIIIMPVTTSVGFFDKVIGIVNTGAAKIILAADIAQIATYPFEYTSAANTIIQEINQVKNAAGRLNLSKGAVHEVLRRIAGVSVALTQSLFDFEGMVTQLTAISTDVSGEQTNTNLAEAVRDIKKLHKENMQQLAQIRMQVGMIGAAMMADGATLDFMNKTNPGIYKNKK